MAMSAEQKLVKAVTREIADFRFNDAHFSQMMQADKQINLRFFDLVKAYIVLGALDYEHGNFSTDAERRQLRLMYRLSTIIKDVDISD